MKKTAFNIALAVCTVLVCIAAYFSGLKSFRELETEDECTAAPIQESDKEENSGAGERVSHKDCFWAVAKEHEEFKEDNCVAYAYEGDFDGEKVGLPYEIPPEGEDYSYDYEIASQVEFSFVPDGRILLDAVPDSISEISPIGFGPAHGVQAEVCREDDEWKISKVNYRDEGIDFVLEEGIPLWLAGAEKDFMAGYCADHDVQMPEEGTEISYNAVSYVDSSYPADQVESGNVKAEVRVWLEGEAETIDLGVWVVYEDDEEREGWFIYKIEKEGVGH